MALRDAAERARGESLGRLIYVSKFVRSGVKQASDRLARFLERPQRGHGSAKRKYRNGRMPHGDRSDEATMAEPNLAPGTFDLGQITPDEVRLNNELRARAVERKYATPFGIAPQPVGDKIDVRELAQAMEAKIIGRVSKNFP